MGAGEESEAICNNRCRNRNIAAAFEMPEFAAGLEVEATDVFPTVGDDLGTTIGNRDGGCAPGSAGFFAGYAPELRAVFCIEHGEVSFAEDVALNDNFAVVENGRTGEAPLKGCIVVGAGVHFTEVFVPLQLAVHVEAEKAFGTEDGDNAFAVGGGG